MNQNRWLVLAKKRFIILVTAIIFLNVYIVSFRHYKNYIFAICLMKTNEIPDHCHPIFTFRTANLYCVCTSMITTGKLLILMTISEHENDP